jgi:hypothetical protein
VSRNFLPFKGKSPFLSSQAAPFFSFAKGKKYLLQRNPAHMTRAIFAFCFVQFSIKLLTGNETAACVICLITKPPNFRTEDICFNHATYGIIGGST